MLRCGMWTCLMSESGQKPPWRHVASNVRINPGSGRRADIDGRRLECQFRTWVGSHLRRTVGLMTTSNFSGPGSSLGARRLDAQAPYAWLADVIEKMERS